MTCELKERKERKYKEKEDEKSVAFMGLVSGTDPTH